MNEGFDHINNEFEWCLVGNIIDKHLYGENKEIRSGTKHFRAGAKVYCLLEYGGMGHERIRVIGLPRRSQKMIDIVIDAALIKNMRLQKVYQPLLIEKIQSNSYYSKLGSETIVEELQNWADHFNSQPSKELQADNYTVLDQQLSSTDILNIFIEQQRLCSPFDTEADPSIKLSFDSTISEWRAANDLIDCFSVR